MSTTAQIEVLISLAALDQQLSALTGEFSAEREALSGKRQHLAELEEKLGRSRQSIEEMERTRSDLLSELRQMNVQVEKSREKLSRCRTEREANAAQRELEELRKLHRDREQDIEKLVGLVEQARGDLVKTTEERDSLAGELGSSEGAVEGRLSNLSESTQKKESERKELVKQVDPALYRRYERVRKARGSAIASVREGACAACHMRLPPMLFQQIMQRQDFKQCPSCHRILYFVPPSEASTDTQTSGPSA